MEDPDVKFELQPLPYPKEALEPYLSRRTLEFHYEKHHRGYMTKLAAAIEGTRDADCSLEDLVIHSQGPIFNNAAQVWNHTFYWNSMAPGGGGHPTGDIGRAIDRDFGSYAEFRSRFVDQSTGLFGSGYVWLYFNPRTERLQIDAMKDAANPMLCEGVPVLGMDVWEHAYYLDYQNGRDTYVGVFLDHLANWEFAGVNMTKAR
jgi:Fe-Mn family superoxide dismutase